MADRLYCLYADLVTIDATLSLTAGTANGSFPLTNLQDERPDIVFKATGTSATIRATFGAAQRVQGIALINHNLHGLTLTVTNNGAMPSIAMPVPAAAADGLPVNPWLDLRQIGGTTATQWNVAITGAAANVAIGELLLMETLSIMPMRWNVSVRERHPIISHHSEYHIPLRYGLGVRYRSLSGEVNRETERAAITNIHRSAKGALKPWAFILDSDVNDCMMVQCDESSEWTHERQSPSVTSTTVAIEEMCAGVVL